MEGSWDWNDHGEGHTLIGFCINRKQTLLNYRDVEVVLEVSLLKQRNELTTTFHWPSPHHVKIIRLDI